MNKEEILNKHFNVEEAYTDYEIECLKAAMQEYADQQARPLVEALEGLTKEYETLSRDFIKALDHRWNDDFQKVLDDALRQSKTALTNYKNTGI